MVNNTISITVASVDGGVTLVSVDPASTLASLHPHVQSALSIPVAEQLFSFNGIPLASHQTFASATIVDGDLLIVERHLPTITTTSTTAPPTPPVPSTAANAHPPSTRPYHSQNNTPGPTPTLSPQALRDTVLADPALLQSIREANPPLHHAIVAGNTDLIRDLMASMDNQNVLQHSQQTQQQPLHPQITLPDGHDPMSVEVQAQIEERIRMENVQQNFQDALEHNPESFAQVTMLFIDVRVNGRPITAFVDSGAQSTIISKACAARCDILRLLDKRFAGIARGVGTATIFGKIHLAILDVAGECFEVSLTVMDDPTYDLLLGLDMLRKHRACIDLVNNCLRIGDSAASFLPEHRIPKLMLSSSGDRAEHPQPAASGVESHGLGRDESVPRSVSSRTDHRAASLNAAESRRNQAKIEKLMNLGFSAEDATLALQQSNGDEERAASLLTQEKYGF